MLDQFPDDINLIIWNSLTQTDRLNLLLIKKSYNKIFTKHLYKNLFLNDQRVLTLHQRDYLYDGTFSEYSYLKFYKQGERFKKTYNSMRILINTLKNKPEYLLFIENVKNSWHLNIDLKLEFLNLLIHGVSKNDLLYKGFNLKSFENNLNIQIFNKLVKSDGDNIVASNFKALDIPFLTRLPISEELENSFDFNGYFGNISNTFNKILNPFSNIMSLTIHFNPLIMNFCKNKKLKLKYLCLNIREKEFDDSMKYLNYNGELNCWDDLLDVSHLRTLELVSWLPNPQAAFLKDFELEKLLRLAKNIEVLKTFSFPYSSNLMSVILNECLSLKELRLDFFDLTQAFTRLFIEKHSTIEKYSSLCNLEKLHIEMVTVSYKDPDFLINLLRDHPQFDKIRSTLPCTCDECIFTVTEILSEKIFFKPPFIEFDPVQKSLKSYVALYLLFKEMMYVMPHKSSFDNLFVQYGILNFEQLKNHLNSLYSSDLTVLDLKKIYDFMLHFYKRGFSFMFNNFPKLKYLNLNDLPVIKIGQTKEFKQCFEFEVLV